MRNVVLETWIIFVSVSVWKGDMPDTGPPPTAVDGLRPKTENPSPKKRTPIANKPGEPKFQMVLEPDCITFVCTPDKEPVWCELSLKNTTSEMQCYRVKQKAEKKFRAVPPLGFVKTGETVNFRMWFWNDVVPKAHERHFITIYHVKTSGNCVPKDVWTKATRPDGVRHVDVVFINRHVD